MVLLAMEGPGEISRWYTAAALDHQLDGDPAAAAASLDRAVAWSPRDVELRLLRAEVRLAAGDAPGALEDCNRAAELAPDNPHVYWQRSEVHRRLGQPEELTQDIRRVIDQRSAQNPGDLNTRAYGRSIIGSDLEQGLREINAALRAVSSSEVTSQFLDTRGHLLYRLGRKNRALADLNEAITMFQVDALVDSIRVRDKLVDRRELLYIEGKYDESLAVMYYHRGLVHRELGHRQLAEQDMQRVRQLGFDPEEGIW